MVDLLHGDYKQSEYGCVILPFTVLRRLDCVLAPTKAAPLRDTENVPLDENVGEYFEREVKPYAPDAWVVA